SRHLIQNLRERRGQTIFDNQSGDSVGPAMKNLVKLRVVGGVMSVSSLLVQSAFADSVSLSPAEGNALTPFTITVDGFIGTNGPVGVSVGGGSIAGSCSTARPCTFSANMGYYSGKFWVEASAMVDGVYVVVSNSFTVHNARAYIDRACGSNGTKIIVTG